MNIATIGSTVITDELMEMLMDEDINILLKEDNVSPFERDNVLKEIKLIVKPIPRHDYSEVILKHIKPNKYLDKSLNNWKLN